MYLYSLASATFTLETTLCACLTCQAQLLSVEGLYGPIDRYCGGSPGCRLSPVSCQLAGFVWEICLGIAVAIVSSRYVCYLPSYYPLN